MKRPSLRKSIDAKCKECIYDSIGGKGAWREQVEDCTSRSCPLFDVRPKSYRNAQVLDVSEATT